MTDYSHEYCSYENLYNNLNVFIVSMKIFELNKAFKQNVFLYILTLTNKKPVFLSDNKESTHRNRKGGFAVVPQGCPKGVASGAHAPGPSIKIIIREPTIFDILNIIKGFHKNYT